MSASITTHDHPLRERIVSTGFNFSLANFTDLDSYFLEIDFSPIYASTDVEFIWSHLKGVIWDACNLLVPLCERKKLRGPHWYTSEVRHLLNRVHTTRRRIKQISSACLLTKLDCLENVLGEAIVLAKAKYETHLVSIFCNNPSKLYRHLAELSRPKSGPQVIIDQEASVHDLFTKVKLFNQFFNSTFTVSDFVLPSLKSLPCPNSQLSHINIDSSDVYQTLIKLDPTKAVGCDKIPPRLLKYCATSLTEPITHLLSTSISTCTIPDEWKVHQITPVFKKGDKTNVVNHRPISLLCIISKVLEPIVYDKVAPFIRPLLSKQQFGFLKHRSCLTQLLLSFARITDAVEHKCACSAIYLDLCKAFDSVPHGELLYKLWKIGITGPLWCWFRNYLSHRKHYVSLNGVGSPSFPVLSGVPQGSILGPLLYQTESLTQLLLCLQMTPNCFGVSQALMTANSCKKILLLLKDGVTSGI